MKIMENFEFASGLNQITTIILLNPPRHEADVAVNVCEGGKHVSPPENLSGFNI